MKFYAYLGAQKLGSEPCGTEGKILSSRYKSLRTFLKYGIPDSWKGKPFHVYSYQNLYSTRTYQLEYSNL